MNETTIRSNPWSLSNLILRKATLFPHLLIDQVPYADNAIYHPSDGVVTMVTNVNLVAQRINTIPIGAEITFTDGDHKAVRTLKSAKATRFLNLVNLPNCVPMGVPPHIMKDPLLYIDYPGWFREYWLSMHNKWHDYPGGKAFFPLFEEDPKPRIVNTSIERTVIPNPFVLLLTLEDTDVQDPDTSLRGTDQYG